jgi:hypothetical protein
MDWRNWKNHPFIVTLVGALLLGYLVRKFTEPAPYTYSYNASPPAKSNPVPISAQMPAPVVTSPTVSSPSPQYQVAQLPPKPAASAPVAYSSPVERPVFSTPSYSSGRRGYTTYTFTIGETPYPLDGQVAFDHLSEMKRQYEALDAQTNALDGAIDAERRNLAEMKQQSSIARVTLDLTSQYAVEAYNAQLDAQRQLVNSLNRKVDEFNALNDRMKAIFASMHTYAQQHRR